MKILFLGIMFCDEALKKAYAEARHGFDHAPHIFQANLLSGFEQNNTEIKVINVPPTGSFPINNRQLYSRRYHWGKDNIQIGYLNVPIIKRLFIRFKLLSEVEKEIKRADDLHELKLLLYTTYEPFLDVAALIHKRYPEIGLCLLETDPIPGCGEHDPVRACVVRRGQRRVHKCKIVDSFVVLTKYLADILEAGDRPFSVIECICNTAQSAAQEIENKENIFLYSGTLDRRFGIATLVDVFSGIPEAQLWICGKGDSQQYIIEESGKHDNIRYLGFLDQKAVSEYRDRCNYLINPRVPTGTYTKYSFPSKTAEYLTSGKPTVMYKLEGIPDEYDEYINYLHSTSVEGIREEILGIINSDYSELCRKGASAREFMLREKSGAKQAGKICKLLHGED